MAGVLGRPSIRARNPFKTISGKVTKVRSDHLTSYLFLTTLLLVSSCLPARMAPAAERPNVLFIAIDDQNDWIGHLGGHPLAKTPHL